MTALAAGTDAKFRETEFLDSLPPHWDLRPAVSLARVLTSNIDKISVAGQEVVHLCNYTDVYYCDEITAGRDFMLATATETQAKLFAVRAGDVPITKDSESADDIGISAYVPTSLPDVVYGYHLAIYRPHDIRYGKFLKWLFDSRYAKAYFETRTFGVTRVGLSQNTLRYFRTPTPPPDEAKAIADYLDRETAEIDGFIRDQKELIRLLNERRAATISHAVIKGLDPNTRMKNSGIDWLGEIPAHWNLVPIKHLSRVRGRIGFRGYTTADLVEEGQGALSLSPGNMRDGTLDLTNRTHISWEKYFESPEIQVQPGDTLLVKTGSTFGKVAHVRELPGKATVNPQLVILTPSDASHRFFFYSLQNPRTFAEFRSYLTGGTTPTMTETRIGALKVPAPPASEQRAIANYLDSETAHLDATVSDARQAIALSRERRTALISAAVTGKLHISQSVKAG